MTLPLESRLRLYVLYRNAAELADVRVRSYMQPVNLAALPLGPLQDNRLAEGRFFLHDEPLDREYVGVGSGRWPQKWPRVPRIDALEHLSDLLRPEAVYAPCVATEDWVKVSERGHPGMGARLEELFDWARMWPTGRPVFYSNTFICHHRVFENWRLFFQKAFRHFHDKYGFELGYDNGIHDPARVPAYFYERLAMLYFANRTDLSVLPLPGGNAGPHRPEAIKTMGETSKARPRRLAEDWFDRYVDLSRPGIDIGCGDDPLNGVFRRYDKMFGPDNDAQTMSGVPTRAFWTVYASHVLEHVPDPGVALERWVDLLVPGGYLIISVPHRDLYEKRKVLPSLWNQDHKSFWMPDAHEPPVTRGLRQTIREALGDRVTVLDLRVVNSGYVDTGPAKHAEGEFSIEAVLLRRGT